MYIRIIHLYSHCAHKRMITGLGGRAVASEKGTGWPDGFTLPRHRSPLSATHGTTTSTYHRVRPNTAALSSALAARRGEKGFSNLLAEAIEEFLKGEAERRRRREDALALAGSISPEDANIWRTSPGLAGELAVIAADTDVLIDFLSGVEPVAAQIAGYVGADQLQTTAVTCFELLSGAGRGKTR